MIGTHTSKDFETELRTLRERLCAMGGRCEQQITLAMQSLAERDDELARKVIDNGVKYTQAEGHVWVVAKELERVVRIEVRDDGPGISDKHRERVFERFYRADPSRSREAGGTGLGLSIVKHLVESMGGEVGVEPNAPRGSIFWLQLPRATLPQKALAS